MVKKVFSCLLIVFALAACPVYRVGIEPERSGSAAASGTGSSDTEVSVSFNSNGGSGSMSSVSGAAGATVSLPSNTFSRTDSSGTYSFLGWALSATGLKAYDDGAPILLGTSDLTLYALWASPADASAIGFEADTPSYFQNSTLSCTGTTSNSGGFFATYTALGNAGTVSPDAVVNGVYDAARAPLAPSTAYEGSHTLHLVVSTSMTTASTTTVLNYNSAAALAVALAKIPYTGSGSGLLGDLEGGEVTSTGGFLYINNASTSVTYHFAVYVPAASSITAVGLMLGDSKTLNGSSISRLPAQPLTAGVWNYISMTVLGGYLESGATAVTATSATLTVSATQEVWDGGNGQVESGSATVSGALVCTAASNSANANSVVGRIAGSSVLDPGLIRFMGFVFISSSAVSDADVYIDDITWE